MEKGQDNRYNNRYTNIICYCPVPDCTDALIVKLCLIRSATKKLAEVIG